MLQKKKTKDIPCLYQDQYQYQYLYSNNYNLFENILLEQKRENCYFYFIFIQAFTHTNNKCSQRDAFASL